MTTASSGPNREKTGGKSFVLMQQRLLANVSNNNSNSNSSNSSSGSTNLTNNGQEINSNVLSSNDAVGIDNNVTQNQSGQSNISTSEGSQSNSNKSGDNDSSISIASGRPSGKSAAHLMRAQERMKKQSPPLNPTGSPLGNPPPILPASSSNNDEKSSIINIGSNVKPKGKDFTAMAARSQQASASLGNSKSDNAVSNASMSSSGQKPHIPSLPPMDTNIPTASGPTGNSTNITTGNTNLNNPYPSAPNISGRSTGKGKDFAAMLSRSTSNSSSKISSSGSGTSPGLHPINPNPNMNSNNNNAVNTINTTNKNMNASHIPPQNSQAPTVYASRLASNNSTHKNNQNTMNNMTASLAPSPSPSQQQQNLYSNPSQSYNPTINLSVPPTSNKPTTLTKPVSSNSNLNMHNVNTNPYIAGTTNLSSTPKPKPGGKAAQLAALAAQSQSTSGLRQSTLDRKSSKGNRADVSQQQQHQSTFPMQQQSLLQNMNTNSNMTNNNANTSRTNPNMTTSPPISMHRTPSVNTTNFGPSFNPNQKNSAMSTTNTNKQNNKSTMGNSQEVMSSAPQPKPAPKPTKVQGRLSNKKSSTKINNGSSKKSTHHSRSNSIAPTITGIKLQNLLSSISPNYILDDEAQDQILHLADDFLDKLVSQSMKFAKHRDSKNVDVKDVKLALKKKWGMNVEGFGLGGSKDHGQSDTQGGRKTMTSTASTKSKVTNDSKILDGPISLKERGLKRNIIDISSSSTN